MIIKTSDKKKVSNKVMSRAATKFNLRIIKTQTIPHYSQKRWLKEAWEANNKAQGPIKKRRGRGGKKEGKLAPLFFPYCAYCSLVSPLAPCLYIRTCGLDIGGYATDRKLRQPVT